MSLYDASTQLLRTAYVGDSRAVLGRRNSAGSWEAIALSVDQMGYNESEVARIRAKHPNEPEVFMEGYWVLE